MGTWLNDLVTTYAEMETPTSFMKWAGLVSISAILKDNVWLSRADYYNLYPNIYCILYADSGMKKGPATNLAKKLVREVNNTKIISGRSSIQGIMKKLQSTTQSVPGGNIASGKSHGFIVSSELTSSLVSDPAALDLLTDLYDRNYNADDWDSLLKMEEFKLKDPTITLFGGINPAHAENFFAKKDISGGFIARSFIIHEKEETKINALVRRPEIKPDVKKLALYLKELQKLRGPFKELADENNKPTIVGAFYEEWYTDFKNQLRTLKIKDITGTLNRYGDSVLKVAILLSLSKNPVLEIDLESMMEAIVLCEKFIGGVRVATETGKARDDSTNAMRKTILLQELLEREGHSISRLQLLKKYYIQGTTNEWDQCANDFLESGTITIIPMGNQHIYQMTDIAIEQWKNFFGGKMK